MDRLVPTETPFPLTTKPWTQLKGYTRAAKQHCRGGDLVVDDMHAEVRAVRPAAVARLADQLPRAIRLHAMFTGELCS